MMKPEDKVCTLDQAKRLVELGVLLETEKVWVSGGILISTEKLRLLDQSKEGAIIPAPDVAELGELLPDSAIEWSLFKQDNQWVFTPSGEQENDQLLKTEAQSRCAAVIWLLENGHIKAKDIKL